MKNILKVSLGASATLLISAFFLVPVFAHKVPVGCLGSGLSINLYSNKQQVSIGDSISYSIDVFNGSGSGPIVCDASGIQASITTPDGQSHPITLTRTSLSNGQVDHYANVVTYTSRTQDIQSGILTATANDTGTIHQNDTDSQGGGNQGLNVTVLSAPSASPSFAPPFTPPSTAPSTAPPIVNATPSPSPSSPTIPATSATPPTTPTTSGGGTPPSTTTPVVTSTTPPVIAPRFPKTGVIRDVKKTMKNKEENHAVLSLRLKIPKIHVDAPLELVGLTADGSMGVPKGDANAGFFNPGPLPGQRGSAVIDGHSGFIKGAPAVFNKLANVKIGDKIYVEGEQGVTTTFVVREVKVFDEGEDTSSVFNSDDGKAHLNLITCKGVLNKVTNTYPKRLVVFTDLL